VVAVEAEDQIEHEKEIFEQGEDFEDILSFLK
jgi:hypothetical protein